MLANFPAEVNKVDGFWARSESSSLSFLIKRWWWRGREGAQRAGGGEPGMNFLQTFKEIVVTSITRDKILCIY